MEDSEAERVVNKAADDVRNVKFQHKWAGCCQIVRLFFFILSGF